MATCKACGRAASDYAPYCMVCGAPLTPPAKCSGCGHDILAWQKVCPYCGKEAASVDPAAPASPPPGKMFAPVPDPAPAPEPAPKVPASPEPASPRRAPLPEDEFERGFSLIRIFKILFWLIVLAAIVGVLVYFHTVAGFWPVLATIVWFILASRTLTSRSRYIRKTAPLSRDAEMVGTSGVANFALALGMVAVSVIAWIVVFIAAFRKDFGSSWPAFIIGFIFFLGSMLTNYQHKATKTRVVDPDFEQHVEEFGWGLALLRQYYIWGMAAPFIHASFRLFF